MHLRLEFDSGVGPTCLRFFFCQLPFFILLLAGRKCISTQAYIKLRWGHKQLALLSFYLSVRELFHDSGNIWSVCLSGRSWHWESLSKRRSSCLAWCLVEDVIDIAILELCNARQVYEHLIYFSFIFAHTSGLPCSSLSLAA